MKASEVGLKSSTAGKIPASTRIPAGNNSLRFSVVKLANSEPTISAHENATADIPIRSP